MSTGQDRWEFLEQHNPQTVKTNELYRWSLNFDPGRGPFVAFLDLIGWTQEHNGEDLYTGCSLGYHEADALGAALIEWSDNPHEVNKWVDRILELEMDG